MTKFGLWSMARFAPDGDAGAGAGDGAGAGAGAGGGAGAGAGADGGAGGAGAGAPWYGGLDAESQGWLQSKGWATANGQAPTEFAKILPEMIKSHRSVESLNGRNKIALPKDVNDTAAYQAMWKANGWPEKPDGYGFKSGEGDNAEYMNRMTGIFHKHGLGLEQAKAIVAESNAFGKEFKQAQDELFKTNSKAELDGQRQAWGQDADRRFAAVQRAKVHFGVDKGVMEKIERSIGTKQFLDLFSKFGESISEDRGAGNGGGGGGFMTKEAAQARLNDLKADGEWRGRYEKGGSTEVAEFNRLLSIVHAAKAA